MASLQCQNADVSVRALWREKTFRVKTGGDITGSNEPPVSERQSPREEHQGRNKETHHKDGEAPKGH